MELDSIFKLSPKCSIEFEKKMLKLEFKILKNLKTEFKSTHLKTYKNFLKCQNHNQIIKDL
jgi:hypothetical protein